MKNLNFSFYFYAAFLALAIFSLLISFFVNDLLGYIVLTQLFWGPISLIHCVILFFSYPKNEIKKYINFSFAMSIVYFIILAIFGTMSIGIFNEDYFFTPYVFIVPWFMLAYFTFIQYLIGKHNNQVIES